MQAINSGLQLLSLILLMNWIAHACRLDMLRRAVQTEVTLADPLGSNLNLHKSIVSCSLPSCDTSLLRYRLVRQLPAGLCMADVPCALSGHQRKQAIAARHLG